MKKIKRSNADVVYGKVISSGKQIGRKLTNLGFIKKHVCHQSIFYSKRIFEKFGLYDIKFNLAADRVMDIKWFSDTTIKKEFINRVIATYSNTGKSSQAIDLIFEKEKVAIYKKYFQGKLSSDIIENIGYIEKEESAYYAMKSGEVFSGLIEVVKVSYLQRSIMPFINSIYWIKYNLVVSKV